MNAKEFMRKEHPYYYNEKICKILEEYHQAKLKDELPTEEEIEDIIWNCVGRQTPMSRHESQIAAKAITKLMKGER